MNLQGRVALVTGASTGIGRATAKALAAEGVRVGVAARTASKLETLAGEIEASGGQALVLPTDIRDRVQIAAMIERMLQRFGRLDILVNNAGVGHWEPIASADPDEWQREIEVNLLGVMHASHIAVQAMLRQEGGHIVNVSSLAGRYPGPGYPSYTASKFGVNGFTDSIMRDLRKQGIRVTLIEPGQVATPMQTDEEQAARRMLDPEDIADAILYTVSRPAHVCINDIQLVPMGDG